MNDTQCSIDGCDRGGKIVRGICLMHYDRLRRSGKVKLLPVPSLSERLAAKLVRTPDGCLEWTGQLAKGYGQISVKSRHAQTHRLAWELANGPIPDGLWVLHHCDNKLCCQTEPTEGYPEGHLFLGTHDDNMADMAAKGRGWNQKKTHCKHGHLFDAVNTYIDLRGERVCRECRRKYWT